MDCERTRKRVRWYLIVLACLLANPVNNVFAASVNDVYLSVRDSIYQLYAINKNKRKVVALGSAVAVTKDYLVTNCHVALAGNFLIAKIKNEPYLARLCYYNKEEDLCIVDVANVDLRPVRVRASKTVKLHEKVYAVGNLRAKGEVVTAGSITNIIEHNGRILLQTDAELSRGSSGGGLFDKDGYLVGITSSGIPEAGIGYAIPTELIMEAIDPKNLPACKLPSGF